MGNFKYNWNEEKEDIISRYKSGDSGTTIADDYNVSPSTIYNWLKKWNITESSEVDISEKNKKDIISSYKSGNTAEEISDKYDVHFNTIYKWLEIWGIDRRNKSEASRKHNLDHSYFSEINNPKKAYWLGFIVADGSIMKENVLSVYLSDKDEKHIYKLKEELSSTYPVYKPDNRNRVILKVRSTPLTQNLKDLGVKPRKSQSKGKTISVPSYLESHYWRGVIDGDGYYGKSQRTITLCGNEQTIIDFCKWVTSLVPEAPTNPIHYSNLMWRAHVCGESFGIITKVLYKNSSPSNRLERKHKIAKSHYD